MTEKTDSDSGSIISVLLRVLKRLAIGKKLDPQDQAVFQRLSLAAFLAWVGLGADPLSSSCYGPPEAFLQLGEHIYLAIFVGLGTAITIFVLSASQSQIIELFPSGGGGYLVSSKLLSPKAGMIAGSALLIDYVLTITLSIASGADAFFSFLPQRFYHYRLAFAVFCLLVLVALNLRGVKESISVLMPIFLLFIFTHGFAIIYAISAHISDFPELVAKTSADIRMSSAELGMLGMAFLILRAYSMGAGTYTGIEAVSIGLPILREPRVETGKRTMVYMAVSLSAVVIGLFLGYILYEVRLVPGKTLNAVLLEKLSAGWGTGAGYSFVLITLLSEAAILFVAAQAGFIAGPRVLANMAQDRWFPSRFSLLSDRLVTQNGVLLMGGASMLLMILSRGSVSLLIVLYSINVFINFVLSQLGMVRHWWQVRKAEPRFLKKLIVNGVGLTLSAFILISIIVVKFSHGGWVTILITSLVAGSALLIKRHYNNVARMLYHLDELVKATEPLPGEPISSVSAEQLRCDPRAKTAVVLVSGFNGLGLHTLFNIQRMFSGIFKNFVFIQVGIIDSGVFKGREQVENLKNHVQSELKKYVDYMHRNGICAEAFSSLGTDVVQELTKLSEQIREKYPDSVFFGGQIVFPRESFFYRLLHNYVVFAVQKELYLRGIPFVIMPIRLGKSSSN